MHVCINCAGIPLPNKILDRDGVATPLDKFSTVININLIGLFNVMSKCAEQMAKNEPEGGEERGVIINISSGSAFEGQIGQCAYGASKSGVLGLNFPASRELGRYGIRVNAIAPGYKLVSDVEAPKRPGDVTEFAHTCAYVVENGYLNGETIRLDACTRLPAR